jgi:hypothetical protein
MKGIVVRARKTYNEKWVKYFERRKDEHYKQELGYIFAKVHAFGMRMRLTTLAEVTTLGKVIATSLEFYYL